MLINIFGVVAPPSHDYQQDSQRQAQHPPQVDFEGGQSSVSQGNRCFYGLGGDCGEYGQQEEGNEADFEHEYLSILNQTAHQTSPSDYAKAPEECIQYSRQQYIQMTDTHLPSYHPSQHSHPTSSHHSRSDIYEAPHYSIPHLTPPSPPLPLTLASSFTTLAVLNQQHKVQIQEEALEILGQYGQYQTLVCGVYGNSHESNTVFLKQISLLHGQVYSQQQSEGNQQRNLPSLRINAQPLAPNHQTRIFFIQYCHPPADPQPSEHHQKLLDLLTILSNVLILLIDHPSSLPISSQHIALASTRLNSHEGRRASYWPQQLLLVHCQQRTITESIHNLQGLFERNSMGFWIRQEERYLEELLKDLGNKQNRKTFKQTPVTGNFLTRVALRLEEHENLTDAQRKIDTEYIFESVINQLYEQSYCFYAEFYDETLQQHLVEERAYPIDHLLQSFQNSRLMTLNSYRELNFDRLRDEEHYNKLEEYMGQKEKLVLAVNKKKTQIQISTIAERIPIPANQEETTRSLNALKDLYQHYDSGVEHTTELLGQILRAQSKKEEESRDSRAELELQGQIEDKAEVLRRMQQDRLEKQTKNDRLFQEHKQKEDQVYKKASMVHKQIQIEKKANRELVLTQKAAQEQAQELMGTVMELEEQKRQNDRKIRNVESEYDFNPTIQKLQRRLERVSKANAGEEWKAESKLFSEMDEQQQASMISAARAGSKVTRDNHRVNLDTCF